MADEKINFEPLDYEKIDVILKTDPTISWSKFKSTIDEQGIKCSQYSFYRRKAHLEGRPFDVNKKKKKTKFQGEVKVKFTGAQKTFLDLLKQYEKISVEDIVKRMDYTKKKVYGLAFRVRKNLRKKNMELAYENGLYFIKGNSAENALQTQVNTGNVQPNGKKLTDHLKGESLRDLRDLSDIDLDDYFDTMKKSIFYGLSAQAIITANKLVKAKKEQVQNSI